jgi:hypothetical protein
MRIVNDTLDLDTIVVVYEFAVSPLVNTHALIIVGVTPKLCDIVHVEKAKFVLDGVTVKAP